MADNDKSKVQNPTQDICKLLRAGKFNREPWNPPGPDEIKRIRLHYRMTQQRFADEFHVSVNSVRAWEKKEGGQKPSESIALLLKMMALAPEVARKAADELSGKAASEFATAD